MSGQIVFMNNNDAVSEDTLIPAQTTIPINNQQGSHAEHKASTPITQAEQYIDNAATAAVHHIFSESLDVKQRLLEHAEEVIETVIDTQKKSLQNKQDKTHFDGNREACYLFGISHTVPKWQQGLMRGWYNVLFVLYFLVACVTIAPINFIATRLHNSIKQSWLAYIISAIIYALVVGLPLIIGLKK